MRPRPLLTLGIALLLASLCPAAHSQQVSLENLLALSDLPTSSTPLQLKSLAHSIPDLAEWVFHPFIPQAALADQEPLTWAWLDEAKIPATQFSLRPNGANYDVLVHFSHISDYTRLCRVLDHMGLPPSQPVTARVIEPLGERFTTPTHTVVFYHGRPAPYPFLVVVQKRPPTVLDPLPTSHRHTRRSRDEMAAY